MASLLTYMLCVVILTVSLATGDITLSFDVLEEQLVGAVITNLKNEPAVVDQFTDEQLRKISFRFLNPAKMESIRKYFSVEEWTGIVKFVEILDRDDPNICKQLEVCIISLDIAINPTDVFSIVHLEINIIDVNDNAPVFPEEKITVSVAESVAPGLLFPIVPASDPDSPDNGIMEYILVAPEEFKLEQRWNEDDSVELKLILKSSLDREETDRFTLTVIAKDGGTPQKSGSVVIDLIVNDENDNSPVFERKVYTAQIWENSALHQPVVRVRARDKDYGNNGLVFYSFSKKSAAQFGSLFTIGRESGEIRLVSVLDYEDKNFISLTIIAKDQGVGSQPAYATVQISVLDQNDHEPSIRLETSEPGSDEIISIEEHSPMETFVVHISVRDLDAGDAGKVDCVIDDELHFDLRKLYEKEYNIVTMTDIDHEANDRFDLKLECYDYGEPSLTATVTVPIVVRDINDHSPVFERSHYVVMTDENAGRHASLLRVVAHDEDSDDNGRIVYMLDDDAGEDFHIDPSTGLITSVMNLDHEKTPFLQFHVIAMDKGEKPRYGRTLVSLTIRDVDDEPPRFEQKKYIFSVSEGLPPRTKVDRVRASDKDGPPYDNFTYFLDGSDNELQKFQIDPYTGIIYTKKRLDRESVEVYHLMVVAQSNRIPRRSDTAQVDIHVTDINDNPPVIIFPKYGNETIHLSNAVPIGYVVTGIEAEDPDFGDNAELSYTISQGNENGEFVIKPDTGEIVVNKRLSDYDNILFRLVIMVEDGGVPKKISVRTMNVLVVKMNFTLGMTGSALGSNMSPSASYIPIIIGVIAGCVLIALMLIVVIVIMKRKHNRRVSKKSHQYWSEKEVEEKGKHINDIPMTATPGGNRLTMADLSLTVKSDLLKQPQLMGKDDSDSGCADVSHAGSQGSNDDPEGFIQKHGLDSNSGTFGHSPPQRVDSFSSWLHSESYNLNQKGNVYRVSEQSQEGSPSSTLQNSRKTVRFTEPRRPAAMPTTHAEQPSLLQPLPHFVHSPGYYGSFNGAYDNHINGVTFESGAPVVMVAETSSVKTLPLNDGSLV